MKTKKHLACFVTMAIITSIILAPSAFAQKNKQNKRMRQHQQGQKQQTAPFASQILAYFDAWDANHDGVLTEQEVDTCVANPQIEGETAAALGALKMSMKKGIDAISRTELEGHLNGKGQGDMNYEKLYAGCLVRLRRAREAVFTNGMPHLDKVTQGHIGDCFFLAPLGCAVSRYPERVRQMITPNPDGTFNVKFGKGKPVTVNAPTDTELAILSSSGGDGMWVPLLEKAFATAKNETRNPNKQAEIATDIIANGGATKATIEMLTGSDTKSLRIRNSKRKGQVPSADEQEKVIGELRLLLPRLLQDKRLICAGTPENVTTPGINGRHAYAVVAFDVATDTLTLWNPHGQNFRPKGRAGLEGGYATQDGVFRLPLADFVQIFGGMSYEAAK
jgi:hypothetical protein